MSDTVRDRDSGEQAAPDPEDSRKPEGPTDLHRRTWKYVLRKVWREFTDDECPDLAAALTFYAVLAIFPAALALTSLLGLLGQAQTSVDKVVEVLDPLVSEQVLGTVKPALEELASSNAAGWALILGLAGALWSASGYVNGFSRAMNRIYEIDEGRPFWKLRPLMLLLTIVVLLLVGLVLLALIFSGSLARSVGDAIGLGDQALTVWSIAKWPLILFFVMVIVALLYWATPNVKQPKFRWISVGAAVAIVVWIIAAVGFSFYVANFSSYNKTYGSLAGVIVGLLFLWLTNLALLLGAELDSELERGRELQAGIAAEEELQLPARDTRNIEKAEKKNADDARRGRRIRENAGRRRNR